MWSNRAEFNMLYIKLKCMGRNRAEFNMLYIKFKVYMK